MSSLAHGAKVIHFGCRLNQYESDGLTSSLEHLGFSTDTKIEDCEYLIINTCTVTNRSDHKNRNKIRKLNKLNPNAKIIVTGCYATTDAEEVRNLPGVHKVIDNSQKANVPNILSQEILGKNLFQPNNNDGYFGYRLRQKEGHARAYLKIQDGCNKSCSYCKIPAARGKARSRKFNDSIAELKRLLEIKFQEIILTGVNIGSYKSSEKYSFTDFLSEALDLKGDFLLRISSIEPGHVIERLANLLHHPKMANFLHIPLQSGSDKILKLMGRGYRSLHFKKRIKMVREISPNVHIGTDVIVGFPGESDNDFEETLNFCRQMNFSNIHIFPFSKRNKTLVSQNISNKTQVEIPGNIIKERVKRLDILRKKMSEEYRQHFIDKPIKAVFIKSDKSSYWLSENYLKFTDNKNLSRHGELSVIKVAKNGSVLKTSLLENVILDGTKANKVFKR